MEPKSTPKRTPPALKPCPFCGGKWRIETRTRWDTYYVAYCVECPGMLDGKFHTHSAAVRAANRRAK